MHAQVLVYLGVLELLHLVCFPLADRLSHDGEEDSQENEKEESDFIGSPFHNGTGLLSNGVITVLQLL